MPAATPVTIPELLPTDIAEDGVLQVPPDVALLNVVVLPTQTDVVPVIVAGSALVVKMIVVRQPVGSVYDMLLVPAETAVSAPVTDAMVATLVVALLHVPPVVVLASVVVLPAQATSVPVIASGNGLMLTVVVRMQPAGEV